MSIRPQDHTAGGYAAGSYDGGADEQPDLGPELDGRRYVGAACTLDGRPATISGRRNAFATVAELDGPLALEWAWETVARIMDAGGAFKS